MKDSPNQSNIRVFASIATALMLLGIFVGWNFYVKERSLQVKPDLNDTTGREHIPENAGLISHRLAFLDFETGNVADAASHLANKGHSGYQSLKMSPVVTFSPGLWIRFKDLNPGDSSWLRATGYVWFSCPPADVKCSLVATCNHNGINFKYMFVALEYEDLKPGQWNRVSIDYHIPRAPDQEDVLQAYFWYRGSGEMLVDDLSIEFYGL